ncbi:MAG TPA: hypothetical protein VKU84_14755 [Stellaceae bacterium]|nr:hypothetical protein [Stellaceae bacterium]
MSETANSFRTVTLSEDEAAQTLPLAQVTWPHVDLEHWRKYIQSYAARGSDDSSGILALRDASDYFCAMFAYRVDPGVRRGLVLTVQLFTAVDLTNSPAFTQRLLTAAETKARDLGCSSIEIRLYRAQSNLALQLRGLGLVDTAAIVSKAVEGPLAH